MGTPPTNLKNRFLATLRGFRVITAIQRIIVQEEHVFNGGNHVPVCTT